jgi:hypothetical protein
LCLQSTLQFAYLPFLGSSSLLQAVVKRPPRISEADQGLLQPGDLLARR